VQAGALEVVLVVLEELLDDEEALDDEETLDEVTLEPPPVPDVASVWDPVAKLEPGE
jgi:hypothetical protein